MNLQLSPVASAPSFPGVNLRVVTDPYNDSDSDGGNFESESAAKKELDIKIEHTQNNTTTEVGHMKIQVIDIVKTLRFGFFDCLDEYSHELGKLALHLDAIGRPLPNEGCWRPEDFQNECFLIYLEELVIEQAWRGQGLGTALFPKLFHVDALRGADFIFTWPTPLSYLEPPLVNGWFGGPTPTEEAAWLAKRDRIIKFYRKAGFRRLANSHFFCLAKDPSHPSHSIPVEADAPFEELPPPATEEEARRRYMAYH
ncbi:hypothetical protein DFH07DRAFT_1055240 [Mycena maculata]|uniref:N-acetyltransferase domain-containing protein n=1 Tax=Mycena maculata TaxID=230809 RepID=A0AAD7KBL6_9AGAR|nr:hypothetical protein DFH07DRAFT_1055240 [Mycena maculata]